MSDTATITPPALDGRTVLVTGAGEGLGAAVAVAAGAAGAEIVLVGRTVRKLESVYDRIVEAGGPHPGIVPLDLEGATPDDYADIVERIEAQCGGLDALVHNAALLGRMTSVAQYPPLEWMRVLQVNLNAPVLLTQACLPLLQGGPSPAIVFIDDPHDEAYWGAYGVSKAGLRSLAAMLQQELGGGTRPVAVHRIEPGPMRTGLRARAFPGEDGDGLTDPDDVAARILSLLAG